MSQLLVLAPQHDTDLSAERVTKVENRNEDKQKPLDTSSSGQRPNTRHPDSYYVEAGRIVGVLKGEAKGNSSSTARLSIDNEGLWIGIDDLLTEHFGSFNAPQPATELLLKPEPLDPIARQAEIARQFTASLRHLITRRGFKWREPAVSHEEYNNTVEISWWRADKALIFTIAPDKPITFLKVWGPDMNDEMEDGVSPLADQLLTLWQWLYPN